MWSALDILSFMMLIGHMQMQLNGGLWLGSCFQHLDQKLDFEDPAASCATWSCTADSISRCFLNVMGHAYARFLLAASLQHITTWSCSDIYNLC